MYMQKTAFQVKRSYTAYDRDKTSITNDSTYRTKEFYLDQTFSTWVPSKAITHYMREIVDNKAERNMGWGMFAILDSKDSFNSKKTSSKKYGTRRTAPEMLHQTVTLASNKGILVLQREDSCLPSAHNFWYSRCHLN